MALAFQCSLQCCRLSKALQRRVVSRFVTCSCGAIAHAVAARSAGDNTVSWLLHPCTCFANRQRCFNAGRLLRYYNAACMNDLSNSHPGRGSRWRCTARAHKSSSRVAPPPSRIRGPGRAGTVASSVLKGPGVAGAGSEQGVPASRRHLV